MTVDNFAALLGAREDELSAIYENVPGIVFYIAVEPDGEFRFRSVSREFLTATGLSREQVAGSLVRDVIPPPSCDKVLNRYREAIRSGQPVRWEEKSEYPTGQKYGEVAVTPLYDASGHATHLIGIVHDITERKRLEERLAKELLEAAPDAMVVENPEGRIILVNAQTERLFGYRREEMIGQNVELLIPPRFRERHQAHQLSFLSQPRIRHMGANFQLSGLRKDGTEFPLEISLSPMQTPEGILVTSAIRDISERKAAEESRLRLATIVESCEDAIIGLDMNGIITDWNKGAERLFGYSASEATGQNVLFLSPADVRDDAKSVLKKVWQGEAVKHQETLRRRKNSTSVDISLTVSPIVDAEGRVVGASGIARDITERKRAEQELATATERLLLAIESGSVGGWDYNLKTGRNVWFGEAHAQLGMSPNQTSGSPQEFRDRLHKDDRERVEHALEVAREKREDFAEDFRVDWGDGQTHWLRSRGRFSYSANGEPERMLGLSVDITHHKLAEERLRESEEKFHSVFSEAGVGMVIVSPEGRYLAANRTFCGYLGYTEEELLAKTVESITFPEDWPSFSQKLSESLTNGSSFQWVQKRCLHKSGRVLYTETSASVIRSPEGHPQYFVAEVLDITERKRAEEALAAMTRKLVEAQEQERARIGRELHDDINQRLAMLAVELEQLQDDPSDLQRRVQELRKGMGEISNDVQGLSHELHSSKLEYLGVVAGIRSWCKEFGERQKMEIQFSTNVSNALPQEIGLTLLRILQEALHNAIKHSGVRKVSVQLREHPREIHLVVSDAGKGFETEGALLGEGLGLTSMCERARLVNGTIAIDSKPMAGTTIHVRVPLESKHDSQRAAG